MFTALDGIRVVDLSVNAPGPFASMVLADLGADVVTVVNPHQAAPDYAGVEEDPMLASRGGEHDALARGKTKRALDLRSAEDHAAFLELAAEADVVISEMRPGKLERLGAGWESLRAVNSRLILCEISGYGRNAPHALQAGHDINYLALSGALSLIRDPSGKPVIPQNLIGDYASGGMLSVVGIMAALILRDRTGTGLRIDVSITEGIKYLMADISAPTVLAGYSTDDWKASLNGGMPTYDTYESADGEWIAVGALEPKFIAVLADKLDWPDLNGLMARKATWPQASAGLRQRFLTRRRPDWIRLFEGSDACVTPVLSIEESHPSGPPSLAQVMRPDD